MIQNKDKSKQSSDNKKEYNRIYRENHREHYREIGKIYREENKEKIRNHYTENQEEINKKKREHYKEEGYKYHQKYHKDRQEEETKKHKEWYNINKEKANETQRKYRQTPKGIEDVLKQRAKHRSLGYVPLNKRFDNSEAHHLNCDVVIHIPKDMHRSISHNVWTGKNMDIINKMAFDFLELEIEQFTESI